MNALHEQFVVEARELIQQANDDLIAAEREGFSDEQIDRVFRAFTRSRDRRPWSICPRWG